MKRVKTLTKGTLKNTMKKGGWRFSRPFTQAVNRTLSAAR